MAKIENHGLPTRATVGVKGDIYIDLDTGVKYECRGTYGFVDVDSVDEPVEYKWERVDMIDQSRLPESLQFGSEIKDNVLFDGEITLSGSSRFNFDKPIKLKPGCKYSAAINGVEYVTTIVDNHHFAMYPDNTSGSSIGSIGYDGGTIFTGMIGITDPNPTISLKVYRNNDEVITPIDKKYLPETLQFGSEVKQNVLFDGEIATKNGMGNFTEEINFEVGKIYKVIIDGTEYSTNECYYDDSDAQNCIDVLHDNEIVAYMGERYVNILEVGNATHTLKIYTEEEVITPIDNRCLPNSCTPYEFHMEENDYGGYDLFDDTYDAWELVSIEKIFETRDEMRPYTITYWYAAGKSAVLSPIGTDDIKLYFIANEHNSDAINRTLFIFNGRTNSISTKALSPIEFV